ncbi:MAG TPA: ABC transporter substrate-binding protein [Methylomirabilota bacterium]|jgi:putative ABC transport system substrate-binding protein|nr:ABC transporter substrate-binding protein [Methylomirabilota bacterium]
MSRAARLILASLAVGLLAAPLAAPIAATSPPGGKLPTIGVLRPGLPLDPYLQFFRQGLRDLGYVEGRTIAIEYRWAHQRVDQLPSLAADLVQRRVDLIMVAGTTATRAVQRATGTVPIVMAAVGDPVASRFVVSLARPGGNITGVTLFQPGLGGKRLTLLKQAVPSITQVAVLRNPSSTSESTPLWTETRAAAQSLGLKLHMVEARNRDELGDAFTKARRAHAEAFIALSDPVFTAQRGRIVELAATNRLPAIYDGREFVEAGGLMAYAASLPDQFRRAALYVDKILKGAKPADLPVEQPTRFELVINLKTAKALGLTIPPSVLQQADETLQ